jgi:antitoxin VapB
MDPRSRHVRLFKNGRNQAVRIPREMELPGDEAVIYRDGQRLIIEPVPQRSLTRLISSWEPLDVEWPEVADQPAEPVDLDET